MGDLYRFEGMEKMKLRSARLRIKTMVRVSVIQWLLLALCLPLYANSADLITPGHCVGQICLGSTKSAIRSKLGAPNSSEKFSRRNEADVWVSRKENKPQYLFVIYYNNKAIDIHITSNSFKTKEGISLASSFSEIRSAFPYGSENEYVVFSTGQSKVDWVVKNDGITFTFSGDTSGPVSRIAVHLKRQNKAAGYSEGDEWYWYPK